MSFDYGQRHKKEIEFVKYHVEKLGVEWVKVYIPKVSKRRESIPEGPYSEEAIKKLVSPYRNALFIIYAAAYVAKNGGGQVWYAAHTNDWAVYPDCRPEFVEKMNELLQVAHLEPVKLQAPFVNLHKYEIVRIGHRLGVDYSKTWSCYKGGEKHCGKCPTCIDRKLAFSRAGVADPTEYADSDEEVSMSEAKK